MTEKRRYGSWIAGGLATLVAGYLSYTHLTPHKQPANALSDSEPAVKIEPKIRPYDAGAHRTLNTIIASIRERRSRANEYRAVPVEGYAIDETFPVDENSNIEDLGELFYEDCEGVCIYMRDSSNIVTKVKAPPSPAEPIMWYDEQNECFRLTGKNFWFYTDENGVMKAWGVGKENSQPPEKVYSVCE